MNFVILISSIIVTLYSGAGVFHTSMYMIDVDSVAQHVQILPDKYLSAVKHSSARVERLVNKRTDKLLRRLLKEERKMKMRLRKIDTVVANDIFAKSIDSLEQLRAQLKHRVAGRLFSGNNYLDSLGSVMSFLGEKGAFSGVGGDQLSDVRNSISALQGKLQQADQIKAYIRRHKRDLQQQLSKYAGFPKALQRINKEAYYYGQQVNEYKQLLKDKKSAAAKAMQVLNKLPVYNDFLQRHAQIVGIFNGSLTENNIMEGQDGLQTRGLVERLLQQRFGGDPVSRQVVSQQMEQASSQLSTLKESFPDLDNAEEMPDFKPNPMKTKCFVQRLGFGGNIQFQKSSRNFPTTADIGGQVGYKFHRNGSAGLGASYKLGLGTGWDNIVIRHQGVGVRSFFDWKLKGIFFVNGGFEQNYVRTIVHASQLKDWSGWQASALLGISIKYKISAGLKGNVLLLYDFLAKGNKPPGSPVKLRLGYSL